ncbi:BLUF domain-containing protein [Simiduia curdlanivorans]|uniref:BLUF domain-containing protein n=1 Tax=Simiduia curdlanivorans TaxID=1492769 RepID=A0ABV8V5D9_9GAMM|nr:BLUF domain-containing protein [Simiduia curdlanivorans]MDN3640660.1 BLUF domain-containing protein [Simiduia curdlanivorans]
MKDMIRLVYASRSREREPNRLAMEMGKILRSSRANNGRVGVGGVLYFGNGYFFQCLEGDAQQVDGTFQRISADDRHSEVKILLRQVASGRQFERWSMKFVPSESAIQNYLKAEGLKEFDPFDFDEPQVRRLLQYLTMPVDEPTVAQSAPWWHKIPLLGGLFAR